MIDTTDEKIMRSIFQNIYVNYQIASLSVFNKYYVFGTCVMHKTKI